jgi:hypothetical protein
MTLSKKHWRRYGICIWIGLQLMCFAMFLHPMSPEDFLQLAFSAPVETVNEQVGSEMAFGFWIGLLVLLTGLLGLVDIAHLFKNLRRTKHSLFKIRYAR